MSFLSVSVSETKRRMQEKVEEEVGRKLSRQERRKLARDKRKKKK